MRGNGKIWVILGKKREDFGYLKINDFFSEKGRLEGTTGKFCDFISEKGRLEGTSEIFEKKRCNEKNDLYHRTIRPCNNDLMYLMIKLSPASPTGYSPSSPSNYSPASPSYSPTSPAYR